MIGFTAASLTTLAIALAGCGTPLEAKDPGDLITKCEGEARAAYYLGGATVDEALAIYDRCISGGQ